MSENRATPQLGAPDPELNTFPIYDDADRDYLDIHIESESGIRDFNNQIFEIGHYVCSGNERLRCEECGVWVREGACGPV